MAKIPKQPQEVFESFVSDFKEIYGDDLLSVILYGSGARGEYVRKRSDINFLIVLSEAGIQNLRSSLLFIKKWRRRKVSTPLFLTKQYIHSSLDSYPVEFFNMQRYHLLVYGEDVLEELKIDKKLLRLQCEHEIKGKLLHLREEFLGTSGNKHLLSALFSRSLPAFATLFEALLFLKGEEIPSSRPQTIMKAASVFGLDESVFASIQKVRDTTAKLSTEELRLLMDKYIWQIRTLAEAVDKL